MKKDEILQDLIQVIGIQNIEEKYKMSSDTGIYAFHKDSEEYIIAIMGGSYKDNGLRLQGQIQRNYKPRLRECCSNESIQAHKLFMLVADSDNLKIPECYIFIEIPLLDEVDSSTYELHRPTRISNHFIIRETQKKYSVSYVPSITSTGEKTLQLLKWYLEDYNSKLFTDTNIDIDTNVDMLVKRAKNLIIYGAPGTGKSHKIENEYLGKDFATSKYCRRVTFHPAYTYSQFFGTYKPVSDNDIAYKYVAGPFLDTILDAKNNREQNYVLIIEEINRANVSAVFGDTFQLLDRDETGKSEYEITVSDELAEYAKEKGVTLINNKLGIPSNMYIWATMNSADQGVMPLDTAFKRRWDFEYIGINDGEGEIKNCAFTINNKKINWNSLRKHINSLMATAEINEDKWLGPFFISKHILDKGDFKDTFKSKVLMYLFEDSARYEMEFIIKENYQKDCKTLSGLFDSFEKHDIDIFVGSENIEVETITDGEQ